MTLHEAIDSLRRYVDHGVPVGGFLEAVISNDLFGAMGRADDSSRANLFAICSFVYNDMPGVCWGSPAKVTAWLNAKRAERQHARDREAVQP